MSAAWLDLLAYAHPGDVAEWLTPVGVRVCARLGVYDPEAPESRAIVAAVLAEVRGDPIETVG